MTFNTLVGVVKVELIEKQEREEKNSVVQPGRPYHGCQ